MKYFYEEVLHATDYWLRFEWQHRGSPHVHGLAWLQGAPDIEGAFTSRPVTSEIKQKFITYIDSVVCTMNPAILPDGSDASQAPAAQTNPHVCNKAFADVVDYELDLSQLIATCQRHTINFVPQLIVYVPRKVNSHVDLVIPRSFKERQL